MTIPFAVSFGPIAILLGIAMIAFASFFSIPKMNSNTKSTHKRTLNIGAARKEKLLITVDGEEFAIHLADPTEVDVLEIEKALTALRKDRPRAKKSG